MTDKFGRRRAHVAQHPSDRERHWLRDVGSTQPLVRAVGNFAARPRNRDTGAAGHPTRRLPRDTSRRRDELCDPCRGLHAICAIDNGEVSPVHRRATHRAGFGRLATTSSKLDAGSRELTPAPTSQRRLTPRETGTTLRRSQRSLVNHRLNCPAPIASIPPIATAADSGVDQGCRSPPS